MKVHSQRRRLALVGNFFNDHHRTATLLICLSLGTLAMCLVAYFDWQERNFEADLAAKQAKQDTLIKADLEKTKKQRLATALAAEQAAKENSNDILTQMKGATTSQTDTTQCGVSDSASLTVIINKKHCFSPTSYAPSNLTSVDGHLMRDDAAAAMTLMQADAAANNAAFTIFSGYRSYSDQVITYNSIAAANGVGVADTMSARPGYSEHQTGLAADLETPGCALDCFETTKAYAWLTTHAASYGFIQRYPSDMTPITGYATEPWHWRYIGKKVALDIKAKGLLTLEEYFGISGGDYN